MHLILSHKWFVLLMIQYLGVRCGPRLAAVFDVRPKSLDIEYEEPKFIVHLILSCKIFAKLTIQCVAVRCDLEMPVIKVVFFTFQSQGQSRRKGSDPEHKLVESYQKILAKLLSLAPTKPRNYILDQVLSAMLCPTGFTCFHSAFCYNLTVSLANFINSQLFVF